MCNMIKQGNVVLLILQHLLIYTLSIICIAALPCLYVVFGIIRQIVNFSLYCTISNYGGLISTQDLAWAVENSSKNIINIVMLIKYNKKHSTSKSFYDTFKKKVFEEVFSNPDKYLKLTGTRHQHLGYQYIVKNTLSLDDCVKQLDTNVKSEEDLKKYLSKTCNLPLPKNHSGLWDITAATRPITWQNHTEIEDLYPIIFRVHHTIGDGWSLANFLITILCDPQYQEDYFLKSVLKPPVKTTKGFAGNVINVLLALKRVGAFLKLLLNCSVIMLRQIRFMNNKEEIVFNARYFTGKKIIRFATEENEEMVPLCREMRRKFDNAKFSQIIFGAVGHSLSAYFQKRFQHVPDYVHGFAAILLKLPKRQAIPTFDNHLTAAKVRLPINPKFSMKQSVEFFNDPAEAKRVMEDAQVNYVLMQNIGVLPLPLLRIVIDLFQIPVGMTNLPMPSKLEMLNGCEVFDFVAFPPNWSHSGITFTCTTYKNRFQMGILVDDSLISSEEEAQNIVNDVLRNFVTLNKELSEYST